MAKLKVGILGATGAAGLEFVRALNGHPWFEIDALYASERNAGRRFEDACRSDVTDLPDSIRNMRVRGMDKTEPTQLMCSALPSDVAKVAEVECAKISPVISTTSAHRYAEDVLVPITEVNGPDYKLLEQQKKRGWEGWVMPGPNCTTVGLAMSLAPLYRAVGVKRVNMSSYQAVSGGGVELIEKWKKQRRADLPQPFSDVELNIEEPVIEGNVIGYIPQEENKVRTETRKILGASDGTRIVPAGFAIDCQCVRVPGLIGHFETVFVETERPCSPLDLLEIYNGFNAQSGELYGDLPSSPRQTITVMEGPPQPRLHAKMDGGMTVVVGRIEQSPSYENGFGIRYQALSNNLERGAAKGIVHAAEYLHKVGFLK